LLALFKHELQQWKKAMPIERMDLFKNDLDQMHHIQGRDGKKSLGGRDFFQRPPRVGA